jgi:hypothetical protein
VLCWEPSSYLARVTTARGTRYADVVASDKVGTAMWLTLPVASGRALVWAVR